MKGDNLFCDVELEFAGGLDTLTVNQRKRYKLRILTTELTVSQLVAYVRKTAFAGRKDMFSEPPEVISSDCQQVEVQGDLPGQLTLSERSRVRPGVLVLVDDVDWELLGSGDCIIKGSKSISFISSLHGG